MRIVVMTGAGISAESGIPTYRDEDGLWTQHNMEEVASRKGYLEDPQRAADFFEKLREAKQGKAPNAAHYALAALQNRDHEVTIVTQNIDGLHQEAGSRDVIEMHGSLRDMYCDTCTRHAGVYAYPEHLDVASAVCFSCAQTGTLRPDVTYFGEVPRRMGEIYQALFECDVYMAVGTSGEVQPASSFMIFAQGYGAKAVELNLTRTDVSELYDIGWYGPASNVVPMLVGDFDNLLEKVLDS